MSNVGTKVCSADDLPFDDATFDSVSVRFGYMFFPDVAEATAEFARVLKPGGRLCSSVWVKPEENPWTTIAMQAIAAEAELAPADPDGKPRPEGAGVGRRCQAGGPQPAARHGGSRLRRRVPPAVRSDQD